MDLLPKDVLIEILSQLHPLDFNQVCRVNKRINNICHSEYLWRVKSERDYPELTTQQVDIISEPDFLTQLAPPITINWKIHYITHYTSIKSIPIYSNDKRLGEILIERDEELILIKEKIKELIKEPKYYQLFNKQGQRVSKQSASPGLSVSKIVLKDSCIDINILNNPHSRLIKRELRKICEVLEIDSSGDVWELRDRILVEFLI